MSAIQTAAGHVSRAIDFYQHDDLWFVLSRPFDWSISRLTGYGIGPFTFPSPETLIIKVNGYTMTVPFTGGPHAASSIVGTINAAAALVHISLTGMAVVFANRIRIVAPVPGVGSATVEIIQGSATLGFETGEICVASNSVATPDPTQLRLLEPFAFRKVLQKELVIPNTALAATLNGTVQGYTFTTTGDFNLSFKVDNNVLWTVNVVFGTPTQTIGNVVSTINAAAALVSPDLAAIATIDGTVTPPRVKLTSPTTGGSSMIQILTTCAAVGFGSLTTVTGTPGGAISFRNDQFDSVLVGDAYTESARMVYLQSEFPYDTYFPIDAGSDHWAQVGIVSGVVPVTGLESRDHLEFDEVSDFGILEFIDNRELTPRSIDQSEVVRLLIEF